MNWRMLRKHGVNGKAFLTAAKHRDDSGRKRRDRGQWVAHTSRVLVALFQRDKLFLPGVVLVRPDIPESSRGWNTVASTRDDV
jgi:hypothetical protein